jgi:hypothetical protein
MIKKTYMLIRIAKWEEEGAQKNMFSMNSILTRNEAIKWLQKEAEKNPEDKVFMVDEDMHYFVPKQVSEYSLSGKAW